MTFLPIVDRELRVASRRMSTYWSRVSAGGIAVLLMAWIYVANSMTAPQRLGRTMFVILSIVSFVYSFTAGLRATADSLSAEKREGTMGLLFLTDLKGYDIVLGKLVASSLNVAYMWLAMVPVLALPILLGGVTLIEFARVTAASINLLFFSLAAGMLGSAICSSDRKAVGLGALLVFLPAIFLPSAILIMVATSQLGTNDVLPWLVVSPGFLCFLSYNDTYASLQGATYFLPTWLVVHGMAWTFLGVAAWRLPRTWQERPQTSRAELQEANRDPATLGTQQRSLLDLNPFYWLTTRKAMALHMPYAVLALAGALWLFGYFQVGKDWLSEPIYIMTALVVHTLIKFWVATEACQQLIKDRKSGALELLLCTPLPVITILRGQILALRRQFAGPVAIIVIVDLVFCAAGLARLRGSADWFWLCAAGILVFIVDLAAIAWCSMRLAMVESSANRAASNTILRICVIPWILFALLMTAIGLTKSRSFFDGQNPLLAWVIISITVDIHYFASSRTALNRYFREWAMRQETLSLGGKIGRRLGRWFAGQRHRPGSSARPGET